MSVTRRPVPDTSAKPKTSLKQALSSDADPTVYREVGETLGSVSARVKKEFYRDSIASQLALQPPEISGVVARSLGEILKGVKNGIQRSLFCKDFSEWIAKEQYLAKIGVEELLRQHKLAESFKSKKELEDKLQQVNFDINKLAEEKALALKRVNLQDSKVRKQFFHEQERITFEVSEDAQKRRREQKERMKRLKERRLEIEAKIREDQKAVQREEAMTKEQQEQQYREKLQTMQYELELRKQQRAEKIRKDKEEAMRVKKQKPLYVKMQEHFKTTVEMPELAKTKAQLAKKREMCSPVRKDELVLFALKHDEILNEKKKKERPVMSHSYSAKAYSTKFTELIKEQERREKIEFDRLEKERRMRADKMKNYANLVKQLHPPTHDEQKAEELKKLKEKIHHTVRSSSNRMSMRASVSPETEAKNFKSAKPRKLKAMSLKETKEFKPKDYLAQLRKERSEYDPTLKLVTDIKGKLAVLTSTN
mmetsp:Transcript_5708/g.10209  ORF Transcript_5708/g.10209 Transcript_5708/m.10209 type:complete len:480 (+) Transcript_5708:3693-5132(+)